MVFFQVGRLPAGLGSIRNDTRQVTRIGGKLAKTQFLFPLEDSVQNGYLSVGCPAVSSGMAVRPPSR
jgi:hypothetical protein